MARLKVNLFDRSPMSTGAKKSAIGELSYGAGTTYATGGDDLTYAEFRFNRSLHHVNIGLSNSGTYVARVKWNKNSPSEDCKIMIFVVATGAQVANGVDLTAERFRVRAEGI